MADRTSLLNQLRIDRSTDEAVAGARPWPWIAGAFVAAALGASAWLFAAQEGEMVSPVSAGGGFTRTGLGTVVDMDSLEVEVDVSENFLSRVRPGQSAAITLNAYPERRLPGRVIAIVPTADRAKATVKVRVGFEQPDVSVLPEMGARVAFLGGDETEEKP